MRVYFDSWGTDLEMPAYAYAVEGQSRVSAICDAIGRKNKLALITCTTQGDTLENDKPTCTKQRLGDLHVHDSATTSREACGCQCRCQ